MTDQQKAFLHAVEMANHSQGVMQAVINAFVYGNLTKEQAREAIDFKIAQMKCGIESNPYLTREQKDNEISKEETWFNALKMQFNL